jgi:hypothetical protein
MFKPIASLNFGAMLVLVFVALLLQTQVSKSQTDQRCAAAMGNVNTCAPFLLPGAANEVPSQECCTALQAVDQGCICSTIQIASRLPSKCNLPPLTCPGGDSRKTYKNTALFSCLRSNSNTLIVLLSNHCANCAYCFRCRQLMSWKWQQCHRWWTNNVRRRLS